MSRDTGARDAAVEHNARAWDRLAAAGVELARPAVDNAFTDARGWLGTGGPAGGRPWIPERLDGLEVLCLAAGAASTGRSTPPPAAASPW